MVNLEHTSDGTLRDAPAMMSPGRARLSEALQFEIAGDMIDFLAIKLVGQTYAWSRATAPCRPVV